ncbi:MAG: RraA family protein [Dehalococcoidia bacterium]
MDATVEAFSKLGTTPVSDALDRLGLPGQAAGIRPIDRKFRVCGRAFTVRTEPVKAGVKGASVGDYIDDVPEGGVVVLDNGGLLEATIWGDILTIMAHRNKLGGTVIHGVCRDSDRSLELNYPIFARGTYMRTSKDRVQVEEYNAPVSLGEVRVDPGDIILGDGDGIVVIAKDREEAVLKIAQEIESTEEQIRNEIRKGGRLDEARKKFRYFSLQSKE